MYGCYHPSPLREAVLSPYQNPTFIDRDSKQSVLLCIHSNMGPSSRLSPFSLSLWLCFDPSLRGCGEGVRKYALPHLWGTPFRYCAPLRDLEYADDTVLSFIWFSDKKPMGLYLNYEKCDDLRLNSAHRISF